MICSKALNHLLKSKHVPNLKVKIGPTDLILSAPLSSLDIAIARNPNQFGLTERDLGLTEMALPTLCDLLHLFESHRVMQSVSPNWLDILSVALLLHFGLTELM